MRAFFDACELHSTEHLRALLDGGLDARAPIDGRTPMDWLLEMYTRSERFSDCVRLLLERGATLDAALVPVLRDDEAALARVAADDPSLVRRRFTMVSAFTPLDGATLLHVAAEFGLLRAARALVDLGADVNARAAIDAEGLGGHTPLFHTVNAHANRSFPLLRLLLDAGADPQVRIHGLTWGRGFEWETTLFDLTPVSYAQCGLLPQMHRDEQHIAANVRVLLEAAGRPVPPMSYVPNRYLHRKTPGAS